MTEVLIKTAASLGPLNVQLLTVAGAPAAPRKMISSSVREVTFTGITPSDYVVMGTRPNGEVLSWSIRVAGEVTQCVLGSEVEETSSRKFLADAGHRGLVQMVSGDSSRIGSPGRELFSSTGPAALALSAILSSRRRFRSGGASTEKAISLYIWNLTRPTKAPAQPRLDISADYLTISFGSMRAQEVYAVGLLNADGFGPIVVVPPFADGVDILFVARGVAAEAGAQRVTNPAAVRVPVAVTTPHHPGIADLLSGLEAPILPGAPDLWKQTIGTIRSHGVVGSLHGNIGDPIATIIGAFFLSRFDPQALDADFVLELENATASFMADGMVLRAWHLLQNVERAEAREEAISLLERAEAVTCVLAAARSHLVNARRILDFPHTSSDQLPPPGAFLDFGADAGGLEAFWGGSPNSPGRPAARTELPEPKLRFALRNSMFWPSDLMNAQ